MSERIPRQWVALGGLVAALVLPSLDQVQKYLGNGGVVAYLIAAPLLLWLGYRHVLPSLVSRVTEEQALFLAVLTWLALIGVFAVLYPIANSGIVGGGSDVDDSLNLAGHELLHGRYPYYSRTYLGNPVAMLPGGLLLALPFVVAGNSAYQSLFWLGMYFLIVRSYLRSSRQALFLMWTLLVLSPGVMQQVVTGGDHPANTIYVLAFALGVVAKVPRPEVAAWKKLVLSGLLGVGLSSRANFLFLSPLVYSQVVREAGLKRATFYGLVTCGAFAAVTFPFWLYDPREFTPLSVQSGKIDSAATSLPFSGLVIPALTGIVAMALTAQRLESGHVVLLRNCALIQAIPVVLLVTLASLSSGQVNLVSAGYGQFSLFFGVLAASIVLVRSPSDRPATGRGPHQGQRTRQVG